MKNLKFNFTVLILVACAVFTVKSQNTTTLQRTITWTGFETWSTSFSSEEVPSFVDAQYPMSDGLPYFVERQVKEQNALYRVEVVNPILLPVSEQEKIYLIGKNIPSDVQVYSFDTQDRDITYFNIQLLPYVKKDNDILKLVSFELQIDKLPTAKKASSAIHSYAESSVLASGRFVKIKVKETGVYKLTHDAIKKMGVDPNNVRVFGYGGALLDQNFQLPKLDDLPEVGVYRGSDYILFYGQGLIKWTYDRSKKAFTHTLNHYANEGYYFITSDVGVGKQIVEKQIDIPSDANIKLVNEFVDYQVHEVDKINLGKTGKVFYGEEFSSKTSYDFSFSFPNITDANISARVDVAASSTQPSTFSLKLNDAQSQSIPIGIQQKEEVAKDENKIMSYVSSNNPSLKFTLTYNRPNAASRGYLNYLELNVHRKLQMVGSAMSFRNIDNLNNSSYNRYQLTGANANVQIWDITDPSNTKRVQVTRNGNVVEFIDSNEEVKQYLAIDPTDKNAFSLEPSSVGVVGNQNIHSLPAADMIIISHPNFVKQAERLAQAHKENDNLTTHVLTTEQVYNEFSSGTPDASAYRWAMKMFYDRAKKSGNINEAPKYLLLFGRGTYDNRGIIRESGDNLVLTYQADNSLHTINSYVTDDYFGFLDDNEGVGVTNDVLDIGIGRIPAVTEQHAEDVVNKITAYMKNEIKGNWKNQLTFVADDGNEAMHVKSADLIARLIANTDLDYQIQKIYLDSYKQEISASGESYPLARKKLHSLINTGTFFLNFMGHAGPSGWTNEQVLTTNDVKSLYNKKLPLWVAATCDFVLFDTKDISAGEFVLLNPVGGGIGIVAAARTVYANQNEQINKYFTQYLFEKKDTKHRRLGDALREAKNKIGTQTNKLSYVLLGDPALRLNYAQEYRVSTDAINGKSLSEESPDTLKALSVNTLKGSVIDENGSKVTEFNGTVEVMILDKIQNIKTLNNDKEGDADKAPIYVFQDRPNILYSGKAHVIDGDFSFTFMMPKDIRYNYGTGRINYYVNDTITGKEGQGHYEKFIVGGSSTDFEEENEGPSIQMYLNTPSFVNGAKVNETPFFVAHISDINGINTVGSGIGHDLKLVIDNDPYTTYTLNENFEGMPNSYQSGTVQLKLPAMEAGKHTLTFYAWDLLNNSSQATLEFEVVPGLAPVIFRVRNYPNPVRTETTFVVEHDRPEVILETTVDVFDLSGRKIFTKQQSSADNLKWDLLDNVGNRVAPGVYMYRVSVKTANSKLSSNANKIIVTGQ